MENGGDPYYTFTDVTDYHAYSLDVFGAKIPNSGVLPEVLSLYNDIGYDTYLESNKLECYIGNISFTAFSERDGLINVYGSIGPDEFGVDIWSSAFSIEVEALVEKEYVLDVREYDFVKYRIDSESNYEIQLKDLTITDKVTGIDFNADFSKIGYVINDDVITYDIRKQIIGDTRHDGKKFVLALQLVTSDDDEITTNDKVLSSIPTDVHILVNGNKVYPNDSSATGRNVIFVFLTQ